MSLEVSGIAKLDVEGMTMQKEVCSFAREVGEVFSRA